MKNATYLPNSYPRCQAYHHLHAYQLPDMQTTVYASAHNDIEAFWKQEERVYEPDMAVYLSRSWEPATVAYHIGWQDYGLPYAPLADVQFVAEAALKTAREEFTVEVGCDGGHGRTGTFLACLAVLSVPEMSAQDCIDHVRDNYCSFAVETVRQEWYVKAFYAHYHGLPLPTFRMQDALARVQSAPTGNAVTIAGTGSGIKIVSTGQLTQEEFKQMLEQSAEVDTYNED